MSPTSGEQTQDDLGAGTERAARRVVYTALIGGYENLLLHPPPEETEVDFVLFTDATDTQPVEGWQVIHTPARFPNDSVRSARFLKIMGHPALHGYNESMWIDNRVRLKTPATEVFKLLNGNDLALPAHSFRQTLEDEFSEVIASGYDDPERVRLLLHEARRIGVADANPYWTGLMIRRHSPNLVVCMQRWYELLLLGSRRDQLSLHIALAGTDLSVETLKFNNLESRYHIWMPLNEIHRDQSVQLWRPQKRSLLLRASDLLRRSKVGRKVARALALPTIPV